jgi:hypothetical protein
VDLGVALVADPQAPEVVKVREAPLDDPPLLAETGAMLGATPSDDRLDPASPEQPPVLVVVIATVGEHEIGLLAGPAAFAGDRPGVQVV